jgi:PAS domain S-box-containing protein
MWNWLKQILSPPLFADEDKTRTANLLNIIVLFLMLVITVMSIAFLFLFPGFDVRAVFSLSYVLVLLGVYALMRWGYVQLASIIFVLSFWGSVTAAITVSDGSVRSPAFSFYFVITLIAGLLLGLRFGSIVAGLSIIAGMGLAYAEVKGFTVDATVNIPIPGVLTIHAFPLMIMVILLYLYTRQLNQSLQRVHDVTAQQNAMLDSTAVGIAFLVDRKFEWVNQRMEELFGYTSVELQDQSIEILYPSRQDYEELGEEAYSLLTQGERYNTERQMKRKDGSLFWCTFAGRAVNPDNLSQGTIWILEDVTERKTAEKEREQLQQAVIEAQRETLKELSTPIIPITDQVIVMSLIGSIDSMRARDITRSLLAGISEHRAKVVILDVTGVGLMDTGIVNHLNKTIQAARLKGAHTIVTGISDAVAESIVELGIDWSSIETLRDLQTGLVAALRGMGIRLAR